MTQPPTFLGTIANLHQVEANNRLQRGVQDIQLLCALMIGASGDLDVDDVMANAKPTFDSVLESGLEAPEILMLIASNVAAWAAADAYPDDATIAVADFDGAAAFSILGQLAEAAAEAVPLAVALVNHTTHAEWAKLKALAVKACDDADVSLYVMQLLFQMLRYCVGRPPGSDPTGPPGFDAP